MGRADNKPEYVQIVELPPGYKAPKTGLEPPKKPRRYADQTSVVEKEEIPGGPALRIRPLPGAATPKARKSPGRHASPGARAAKKSPGVRKPRLVFKTREGTSTRGGKAGHEKGSEKTTLVKGVRKGRGKVAEEKKGLIVEPGKGEVALEGQEKEGSRKGVSKGTDKARALTASSGKDKGKDQGRLTPHPAPGRRGARAVTPAKPKRPNLLLSDTRLSELSRKYQGSGPQTKSKTLRLNTSELKYQVYLIELRHKIEQYWEYPRTAAMRGWEGKLFIDFTVRRDGTLSDIRLVRSSRYPVLDDAAITALKLAAPFAGFPKDFDIDEIKVHGQFVYTLIDLPRQGY